MQAGDFAGLQWPEYLFFSALAHFSSTLEILVSPPEILVFFSALARFSSSLRAAAAGETSVHNVHSAGQNRKAKNKTSFFYKSPCIYIIYLY